MKVLLLAPRNSRGQDALPDYRAELAARLQASGHSPVILEQEPDQSDETLRAKFLRLADACHQAVLIWPKSAAMATTADEIILLQEAYEGHALDVILILHEAEVQPRNHELHVHFPADQSRYLDGILACQPFILPWPEGTTFDDMLGRYTDAFL